MAKQLLNNCGIYLSGYELSGFSNTVGLILSKDLFDATTFGDGSRSRVPGLPDATFSAAGCWSPQEVDAVLQDKIGDIDELVSLAADNVVGGVVYFFRGVEGQYQVDAAVNNVAKWTMSGSTSRSPVVRGNILYRRLGASASSNSTGLQLSGAASDETVYAALHVIGASGTLPSLTVKVQSADNGAFTGLTDQHTFAAKTAIGSEWLEIEGPITDDYWRVNFTISGTDPVFSFVVMLGIL